MLDKSVAHLLSMVASVYAVSAYTVAFALEMWFIFTSDMLDSSVDMTADQRKTYNPDAGPFIQPAFAFITAAIFFISLVAGLLLMLGLIIRSMLCLLAWLVTMALLFFPECGLVLHLALNIWHIDSRNGQVELCFFVVRAIMNMFFMVCVQNLVCQWKSEKQMSNYVSSLNAFPPFPGLSLASGAHLSSSFSSPYYLEQSPAYPQKFNSLGRVNPYCLTNGISSQLKQNPVNAFMYAMPESGSMLNDLVDSRLEKQYSTQSLDRRKFLNQRPSQVSSAYADFYGDQLTLRPLQTRPFDYLQRPGSMTNLNCSLNNNDEFKVNLNHKLSASSGNLKTCTASNKNDQMSIDPAASTFTSEKPTTGNEKSSSINSIRDIAL